MKKHIEKFIEAGFYLLPLQKGSKIPATKHGVKDATVDAEILTAKVEKNQYNVGIACGKLSNIIVLDIDGDIGKRSLGLLEEEFGEIPVTYTVETPNNGLHFYFTYSEGIKNRVGILPGIDVRSDGGYVVSPPSKIEDKRYKSVTSLDIVQLPEWLSIVIKDTTEEDKRLMDSDGYVTKGHRNDYLFRFGCRFWRYGITSDALFGALRAENDARLLPPLSDGEVYVIAQSVAKYDQSEGRLDRDKELGSEGASGSQAEQGDMLNVPARDLIASMCEYLQDKDKVKGQPYGMTTLDKLMGGGMRLGEVTVWHALAKAGKNTVWHKLMHGLLEKGVSMGYASRELTPESEVLPNILSIHFKENLWESENIQYERFKEAVAKWPLNFCRGYGYLDPKQLEAWIRQLNKRGVKYFWFDHLHYMLEAPEDHQEASKLIKLLKTLAKEEDIHINIIVQANKLYEGQQLSLNSIKGGSAIGQALDNLIILERMNQYDLDGSSNNGYDYNNIMRIKLDVARSKLCKLGHFFVRYNTETTDMEETQPPRASRGEYSAHTDVQRAVGVERQRMQSIGKSATEIKQVASQFLTTD